MGDETIAGLFLFCPEEDMDFFKIRIPPPEPNFKFRFLEYELLKTIPEGLFSLASRGVAEGFKSNQRYYRFGKVARRQGKKTMIVSRV